MEKRIMTRMTGGAALMAAVLTFVPAQVDAQMGPRGQRGIEGSRARPGVESVLQMRDQLELTQAQVDQLENVRQAVVQHRASRVALMEELRSQRAAAPRDPEARIAQAEEFRAQAEARRAEAQAFSEGIRNQVTSILTDDQNAQLEQVVARARAYQRGRADGMRGQRAGVRGQQAGMRGQRAGARGQRAGARGQQAGMRGQRAGVRGGDRAGLCGQRAGLRSQRGGMAPLRDGRGFRPGGGLGFGPPDFELDSGSAPPPSES